jgi:ethanolamine utilization cobalamin adenosyltransferase
MNFLTEDDIRSRNLATGGVLSLAPGERLTPSAAEYAAQLRLRVEKSGGPAECSTRDCGLTAASCNCEDSQEITWLNNSTQVPKNHPSIVMRGKLDTLIAHIVLVQTQFDPKGKKPPYLSQCLADLYAWAMLGLKGEITGEAVCPKGMGGMDLATLHLVSREPRKYLGLDHFAVDASMGGGLALLNWLRASVREAEVTAVACSGNMDVVCALNRLSSAVYVLMLLTMAVEKGIDLEKLRKA